MKAAITGNHGQVRLVPSLIPRVSLFQLVGTRLVYSFHPGTQVPVEPNVQLDFRVIVSFFWRHLFGIQKRQNSTYSSETP